MSAGQQESAGDVGAPAANPASELAAEAAMRVKKYEHYLKAVFTADRGYMQIERYLQAYRVFEDPLSREFKMCFSVEMETYSETYNGVDPDTSVQHKIGDPALAAAMLFAPPKHGNCRYFQPSVFVLRDGQPPSPYNSFEGIPDLLRYINMCKNEHLPNPVPKRKKRPLVQP